MRILSGIQPTGELHLGNYLGAVRQWVRLQREHECFFMVVDLHALTVPQNPKEFGAAAFRKVAELIAAGLDPEKCVVFLQSSVPQHTELAWILNTITPLGELERMTQYKDKARQNRGAVNAGLLTYPTLMAADILLYQTDAVPVGKDQTQHLELAKTLAKRFNARYGKTFKEPKALVAAEKEGAKIMSLKDPTKKMSKSDQDASSRVSPFEEPGSLKKKIMGAATDTGRDISYNPKRKPGISNLLVMHALVTGESIPSLEKRFAKAGYAAYKKALAEQLAETLEPLRRKMQELERREPYIRELLARSAKRAESVARPTMEKVKERIGLYQTS